MKRLIYFMTVSIFMLNLSCLVQPENVDDQFTLAKSRSEDLKLSIYITAHAVRDLLADETGRREALSLFRCNGITKAYIEVYRSGLVVEKQKLLELKDFFLKNNIEVVGGIATVPGGDFGVPQEGKLGWFNWQAQKTQDDLKAVMQMVAGVFDEFVVDDFLCTGDTSLLSKQAKGEKSWSQYRMDLLTGLSEELFIQPAKQVNSKITMIIKYPQWYDRFHLFGYDVQREPALFDKVWVGTETRGQFTQRFGFVQPYEGFVNYRWLADISGEKMGGAWFDHGDCDANDFIEQAWQTVLAGTKEIVFFNYYDFVNGHAAHHLVRTQFSQLADLAKQVAKNPVEGIAAYKPPHSDAGGDLYLMDFIGMLGIPLVPHFQYPEKAKVILLPTQAAKDPDFSEKIKKSLAAGSTLVFTSGFLAAVSNAKELTQLAGIEFPIKSTPLKAEKIWIEGNTEIVKNGLDLEADLTLTTGKSLLDVLVGSSKIPFFIQSENGNGRIFTLNVHTFSEADFEAVGEVLLCPKSLGLLEIPENWVNTVRNKIVAGLNFEMNAPTRVVIQPLGDSSWMFHNYNTTEKELCFIKPDLAQETLTNGFTGEILETQGDTVKLMLGARSRVWVRKNNN